MKLAVVGSRTFEDYDLMCKTLDAYHIDAIVSGGAIGADMLAEAYAKTRGISVEVHRPDWDRHGRAAGINRNKAIVDACDEVVAFWDGHSRGTESTIQRARVAGKPLKIVYFEAIAPSDEL